MHTLLRTLLVSAVIWAVSPAISLAADTGNPIVGSWKLNVAKSKYNPGPAPKSLVRTYSEIPGGLFLKYDGADDKGNPTVGTHTIKLDGKEYPEANAPDYDSASSRRVDEFTIQTDQLKGGKVVATLAYTVAKDRRTMTLRKKGVDAHGVAFDVVALYDRL